jgi:DNA-binding MarR family transcriptional regulator
MTRDAVPASSEALSDAPDERSRVAAAVVAETLAAIRHFRCSGVGRLSREGISIAHLHAMWLLQEHGDLAMSRLAELLEVSLSNATGLIDRMEERGLVERIRVPDDRRLVMVRATTHGIQMVETMDIFREDILNRLVARLDTDQLLRLRQVVGDLTEVLSDSQVLPSGGCPEARGEGHAFTDKLASQHTDDPPNSTHPVPVELPSS